jgi:selenide,water dikinase
MCVSNRAAAEAASVAGILCATDVTGFGLLGHLRELALASGVGAAIRVDKIPPIDGVLELIAEGNLPGAIDRNRAHLEQFVDFDDGVIGDVRTLLFDPQTSGGLLIACPRQDLDRLRAALLERGVRGWPIGELIAQPVGRIGVISPLTARRTREAPTQTRTQV